MFDFRIIVMPDGTQIIDRNLHTPYNALTRARMLDYIEVEAQLAFADRMERKAKEEVKRRQKLARNPIYKMACLFGIV